MEPTLILEALNIEQKLAASSTEGYIRVIAGAGSGKTRALAHRFAYLVEGLGIAPNRIMSVTFTNKAANVMKKRIRQLIGDQDTAFISTFHGFCARVLREDIHNVNYPKSFIIMDEEDQKSFLQEIYSELKLTVKDFTYKFVLKHIHDLKMDGSYVKKLTDPDIQSLVGFAGDSSAHVLTTIFYKYLMLQRKIYALDYNDLMEFVLYIFKTKAEVLSKWQKKLEYIQVDEFQDVNRQQVKLVTLLSDFYKNLFIVGDPDQTIYSWRGAQIDFLVNFDKKFPNVKTILMNTNYRSSSEIIAVSNSLIQHNLTRIDKNLIPIIGSNNIKVLHYHATNVQNEAEWIAGKIKSSEVNLSDIVILYRAHYVSRAVEEAFLKYGINYVVHSGISFYQRKEIKDVLSYLRLVVIGDDLAFLRVINTPRRGIGTKRVKFLKDYAKQHNITLYNALKQNLDHSLIGSAEAKKFFDIIEKVKISFGNLGSANSQKIIDILDEILKSTGYETLLMTEGDQERLDNIAELKASIVNYENMAGEEVGIEDYLSKVALLTSVDRNENLAAQVKLMTIHSAKGLEFPYVFVCGLNEGIFPSARTKDIAGLEEERRLAYVAFTRAEKCLYLTDAEGYHHDGGARYPSRFLFNINENLLERQGNFDESFLNQARYNIHLNENMLASSILEQKEIYTIGTRINHPIFGNGNIISIDQDTQDYVIKFDDFSSTRNIKKDFAKLNIVITENEG